MAAETPLEQARRHVFGGRRIVERQLLLLDRLQERGRDTTTCHQLLTQFIRSQTIFEADLNALLLKNPNAVSAVRLME
jgi:hypothetical protein